MIILENLTKSFGSRVVWTAFRSRGLTVRTP